MKRTLWVFAFAFLVAGCGNQSKPVEKVSTDPKPAAANGEETQKAKCTLVVIKEDGVAVSPYARLDKLEGRSIFATM